MAEKKIRIMPGGPYEVSPEIPLNQQVIKADAKGNSIAWEKGKDYPKQDAPYHLCRCGHSKNKPFCDGTHTHVKFNDKEVASKAPFDKQCKHYKGDTVDLLDNEELCAVARFCDVGESVWTYAVASSVPGYEEAAIQEACNCPSGRLVIRRKDGERVEPELPQEIACIEDVPEGHRGPLWARGGITLEGADGSTYEVRNRMTLCRCGESGNMPFCDASHLQCKHMEGRDE